MPDAYTNILLRIFPHDASTECYPVEAELDDGSRFSGGKLRLDREALLTVELDPKAYGLLLFNALFAGDIRRAYDKATGIAEVQSGGRLRVRLWVDNEAVELHAIAWERLYHVYRGRAVPMTTSTLTPFSRYTSLEMRDPPPISETPVRMLIAVSNPLDLPGGLMPANIEVEVENLRQALGDLQREGKMQVTLLPGRTGLSPDLQKKVLAAGWQIAEGITDLDNIVRLMTGAHIFHFIGHGHFLRKTEHGAGQAALFLEKPDGRWQAVTDDVIVSTLTSAGTLPHLIFLVACESATRDVKAESPFVGLGPKLVQTGVPAVVAMQAQVPVELARQLSGEFYRRLIEHGEVDQALNQARLLVFDRDRIEWAIPVLFMRMKRGKLFGEPEGDEEAPAPGAPPYKGLEYFDEKDADKFFGREALIARIAGQLRESRFLAVILGASGSGKSSVIRAGLIPALRRGQPLFDNSLPPEGSTHWPIHTFNPGASPLEALAATLTRDEASVTATAILQEDFQRDPRSLHLYVRKLASRANSNRLLLVVDQFEELFTVCKDDAQLKKAFVDNLIYASMEAADGPAVVVIIFRADFYAHCAQFANLREAVSKRQEFIGPMNQAELRRAIEEPAKQGGWELEPGLVDVLLNDVGDEPGALPLLQHALLETWKRRRGRKMTLRGYTESGGIRGAIAKTAEAVYQHLPPEKQAIARAIFLRLVELGEGTQDTRRRAELEELSPRPENRPAVDEVLKTLVDSRLVTTTDKTAEVSHEALIREWPTLRGWLEKNRAGIRIHRDLAEATRDWDNVLREPGALLRGVRLVQALEWAEENPAEMNALESQFLELSHEAAQREVRERDERQKRELEAARKLAEEQARAAEAAQKLAEAEHERAAEHARNAVRMRTLSRIMTAVGVMALVAAVIAGQQYFAANGARAVAVTQEAAAVAQKSAAETAQAIAVTERANADVERANAEIERANALAQKATAEAASTQAVQQAQLAFARSLASASVNSLESDPERSILLALQAVEAARSGDQDVQLAAEEALHRALAVSRVRLSLPAGSHTAGVYGVAFSPDGAKFATASLDTTAKVWDAGTGAAVFTLSGHEDQVNSVAFSPDGNRLATASDDKTAKVWDAHTGQELLTLSGHEGSVNGVTFSPDGSRVATAGADGTVKVWSAETGRELFTLSGHAGAVNWVAVSPVANRLATASDDGTVKVWNANDGQELFTLSGHGIDVRMVIFSPDGEQLATASSDGTAKIWDASSGEELLTLSGHTDWVLSVAFSLDGTRLATTSQDGTAKVWDVETGKELLTLTGATDPINQAAFSPDGRWLVTGSDGSLAKLWDVGPGQELFTLTEMVDMAFSPTDTAFATISRNSQAQMWDARTGEMRFSLPDPAFGLAFSPDGARLATISSNGTAKVWDVATGGELLTLSGHAEAVTDIAFTPDGQFIVTASGDGTAIVWDAANGQALFDLGGIGSVSGVKFSPDGSKFAVSLVDGTTQVWDVATGEMLFSIDVGIDLIFSPDGSKLAVGSGSTASVLDAVTGAELYDPLSGHTDAISQLAFSPDGRFIVTASWDKTVRIWNAGTGKAVGTPLSGHTAVVHAIAFSRDGTRLATASADRTVKLWDFGTGQELLTLYGHTERIWGVAFSPDGTRLASLGDDVTVRVYVLPIEELEALARSRLTRALTSDECDKYHIAPCPTEP